MIDGQTARLLADYHGESLSADEAQLQIDRAREMLEFARRYFAAQPPPTG